MFRCCPALGATLDKGAGRGEVEAGCSGVVRHWVAHKTRATGGVGAGCSGVVRHWVAHKTRGAGWSGGGVFWSCTALGGT